MKKYLLSLLVLFAATVSFGSQGRCIDCEILKISCGKVNVPTGNVCSVTLSKEGGWDQLDVSHNHCSGTAEHGVFILHDTQTSDAKNMLGLLMTAKLADVNVDVYGYSAYHCYNSAVPVVTDNSAEEINGKYLVIRTVVLR